MPACGRNWQESEVPRARLPKRTVIIGKAAQELSARVQQAERGGGEHGGAEPPPSKRPRDAAGMPAPVIGVPLPRPVSDEILEMLRAKELAAQKECSRLHALKKSGAGPPDLDVLVVAANARSRAASQAVLDMLFK